MLIPLSAFNSVSSKNFLLLTYYTAQFRDTSDFLTLNGTAGRALFERWTELQELKRKSETDSLSFGNSPTAPSDRMYS